MRVLALQPVQTSPWSNHRTNPVAVFSPLPVVVQEPPIVVEVQSFRTTAVELWAAVQTWKWSLAPELVAVQ